MPDDTPALVVVAAGGLGTRVHGWARFIPKEFYPVDGRPGIAYLLEEISGLGPALVVIVYHPCYEQFAAWGRQVLSSHDHARYASAAGRQVPAAVPAGLTVSFIPQHGPYGDLTSVLNGADYLAARAGLHVAFADNLYRGPSPLPLLHGTRPGDVAVLASSYRPAQAASHGILITVPGEGTDPPRVTALIEKPDAAQARKLEDKHGTANLLMLEGRARLTAEFIAFARARRHTTPGTEPRLSLALGTYAREHPVVAIHASNEAIDLGVPETPAHDAASRGGNTSPPPATTAGTGPHTAH